MKAFKKLLLVMLLLVSSSAVYAINPPALYTPANGASNYATSIFFDWGAVGGNTGYIYQMDTSLSFNSPLFKTGTTNSNTSQTSVYDFNYGKTYYWRVATKGSTDTSAWSQVYSFSTTDQVNLISPANGASNHFPTQVLDWYSLSGSSYIFEIDTSTSFNSPLYQTGTNTNSYSQGVASNLHFGETYYWRVKAHHSQDTSQWSNVYSFNTTDQVTPVSPANNSANRYPTQTLDWSSMSGTSYAYEIDTSIHFNSPLREYSTTTSSYSHTGVNNLRFGTKYYWRARAQHSEDTSQWSMVYSFTTIDEVNLQSPANQSGNLFTTERLDWSSVTGASYAYEIDTTLNYNSSLYFAANSSLSQVNVYDLRFGTKYYWRARAQHSQDTSLWSSSYSFTTADGLNLLSPANGAQNRDLDVALDWSGISSCSYTYEVDTTLNFNSPLYQQGGTSYNYSQANVQVTRFGTTYYWRVKAHHTQDTSQWSGVYEFSTLDQLSIVSPNNGANNRTPSLNVDWTGVWGNDGYIFELDTTPAFNSPLYFFSNTAVNTSNIDLADLRFGTTYYWRAAAKSTADTSQWSAVYHFTTLDGVSIVSPSNGAINRNTTLDVDWTYFNGNAGYIFEMDTTPNFNSPLYFYSGSLISSYINVTDLYFGTTYYWRAAAKNNVDTTEWSSVYRFTTNNGISLTSPSNGATNRPISAPLDWNYQNYIQGYLYQVDTDPSFSSPSLLEGEVTTSHTTVNNLLYGTTYYWRVAVRNNTDTSAWSAYRSFTTAYQMTSAPALRSPANNVFGIALNGEQFDWDSIPDAHEFEIQYGTIGTFTGNYNSAVVNQSEKVLNNLDNYTQYYWRVRGKNAAGNSPWSSTWGFRTLECNSRDTVTVVNCGPYEWNGTTFNTSGTYYDTIANRATCDSLMVLYLTVLPVYKDTVFVTACDSAVSPSGRYTLYSSAFIEDTLTTVQGCDSIIGFSATVVNSSSSTENVTYCGPYSWNGNVYNSSGTYYDTLTNNKGCDSIAVLNLQLYPLYPDTLSVANCLQYSSPSGKYNWTNSGTYYDTLQTVNTCDSIFVIQLTILDTSRKNIQAFACGSYTSPSGNYQWSASGVYVDTLQNAVGCDSVLNIDLTIGEPSTASISDTVCNELLSPSGKYIWQSSGTYNDTISNMNGCDSVISVQLTVYNSSNNTIQLSSCDSLVSPSGQQVWYASGVYFDTLTNLKGCDSIITVNVVIQPTTIDTLSVSMCGSYISPSGKYVWSNSGTYADTLRNTVGCDSILVINFNRLSITYDTINISSCNSYLSPSGRYNWSNSGIYNDTLMNVAGCDSVIYINLTVLLPQFDTLSVISCETYFSPSGRFSWNVSGRYNDTLSNINGCDSILTIDLDVIDMDTSLLVNGITLSSNESNATYQWMDCNNAYQPIAGETAATFVASSNGSYAVEVSRNNCSDTSVCYQVLSVGLEQATESKAELLIAPNPNNGQFTIYFAEAKEPILVKIYDSRGRLYSQRKYIAQKSISIEIEGSKGLYWLVVESSKGSRVTEKVVKQ